MVFNPTGARDAHGIYPTDRDSDDGPSDASWLELFGSLSVSINGLANELKEQRRRWLDQQRLFASLPNPLTMNRGNSYGASVTAIEDFQGPQPGRQWIVTVLSAAAVPLAANATLVTWYVGQNMPGPAAGMLPASFVRWQFASIPAFQTFTGKVLRVLPGEHLLAGLTGIPASSTLNLSVTINDEPLYADALAASVV